MNEERRCGLVLINGGEGSQIMSCLQENQTVLHGNHLAGGEGVAGSESGG